MSKIGDMQIVIEDLLEEGFYRKEIVEFLKQRFAGTEDFFWEQIEQIYNNMYSEYEEYDAQPTEHDEWMDFDPDC
jgi:hypothetical protein